ncbi:MAG: gamma-glutamyl-gamma-aminobutyrate hydrolase family protein [Bacteroidales bacterium]|nr:gamma-glutamyl-gamma-aminobutyrate hydrolase family protein [Bacteroidales bacterium]
MRTFKHYFQLGFFLLLWITTFQLSAQHEALTIAVSWERPPESHQYANWLLEADANIQTVVLYDYEIDEIPAILDSCDALLLSGGNDIYPGLYGREADTARCGIFNQRRDSLEMIALTYALEKQLPVLGICRGLQLINIHQGGTLYIDLDDETDSEKLHRTDGHGWTQHLIFPEKTVFPLADFSRKAHLVASNHHQGIDKLAESLLVVARSEDGLPEAIVFKNPEKGFLLTVQWHPEWKPLAGELSKPLAALFLKAALEYKQAR